MHDDDDDNARHYVPLLLLETSDPLIRLVNTPSHALLFSGDDVISADVTLALNHAMMSGEVAISDVFDNCNR